MTRGQAPPGWLEPLGQARPPHPYSPSHSKTLAKSRSHEMSAKSRGTSGRAPFPSRATSHPSSREVSPPHLPAVTSFSRKVSTTVSKSCPRPGVASSVAGPAPASSPRSPPPAAAILNRQKASSSAGPPTASSHWLQWQRCTYWLIGAAWPVLCTAPAQCIPDAAMCGLQSLAAAAAAKASLRRGRTAPPLLGSVRPGPAASLHCRVHLPAQKQTQSLPVLPQERPQLP